MTTHDAPTTDERANAVPLIEQLRSVPLNAHHFVEINPTHHRNIPYGPWCHAAADEIERLRELLSIAQDRNAEHCAEVQRLQARVEESDAILRHNMALANATTRRSMDERNGIIRKLRERYSAMEIADMAGLTRQRVHQILNEAPVESSADVPANHVCSFSYTGGQQQDRCVVCGAHPRG